MLYVLNRHLLNLRLYQLLFGSSITKICSFFGQQRFYTFLWQILKESSNVSITSTCIADATSKKSFFFSRPLSFYIFFVAFSPKFASCFMTSSSRSAIESVSIFYDKYFLNRMNKMLLNNLWKSTVKILIN